MNKQDWQQVKEALSTPYGLAELVIDGYRLTLQVQQRSPLKFVIAPYVNGGFKASWMMDGGEEGRRFLRPVQRPVFKPAEKKQMTKGLTKTQIKQMVGMGIEKTFTVLDWCWPTFGPLQRHLIANNKTIELAQ